MENSSGKELERIARLAGLSLSDEEKDILFADLSRIVPYMERIAELNTAEPDEADILQTGAQEADEEKESEDVGMEMALRKDEECVSGISAKILEQAPLARDGMFTVPRTVE